MATNYYQSKYKKEFTPRKPVKTFRDLDIYQKTLECAVIVMKDIVPVLETFGKEDKKTGKGCSGTAQGAGKSRHGDKGTRDDWTQDGSTQRQSRHGDVKYPFLDGITDCAMSVPLFIGEAHSIRFGNFALGIQLIEKAMSGCNKMIIYLEHIKGMYGVKADPNGVLDELVARYAESRTKTFHLEQSWKKWGTAPREITPAKIKL